MTEQAMTAAVQEVSIEGISTRTVNDLVQAMGGMSMSKSQVSRLPGRSTSG